MIRRITAFILNSIIIFNIALLVYILLVARGVFSYTWPMYMLLYIQTFKEVFGFFIITLVSILSGRVVFKSIEMALCIIVFMMIMEILMISIFKTDFGKLLFRFKIETVRRKLSFVSIIKRVVIKYILLMFIPVLVFHRRHSESGGRYLHELLSDTFVLRRTKIKK